MTQRGITTIQVYPETRDALKRLRGGDETYDKFIRRLIKLYRDNNSGD